MEDSIEEDSMNVRIEPQVARPPLGDEHRPALTLDGEPEAVERDHGVRTIVRRAEAAKRHEPEWLGWEGLGKTAEVAVFLPGRVHIAHVGDGCIYRFRCGSLEGITTSHTPVDDYDGIDPKPPRLSSRASRKASSFAHS
jgi:hypothetical protein